MRIGVTGTRSGMTEDQLEAVKFYLEQLILTKDPEEVMELHHGDCVGVDVEIANLAKDLGYYTVNHPPTKNELRAYHKSDEVRERNSYFARNRNIVDECDLLIVVPFQTEWQPLGGTWYTHDYAVKKQKQLIVFYPDGTNTIRV